MVLPTLDPRKPVEMLTEASGIVVVGGFRPTTSLSALWKH
jgi:hypothetical protein